MDTSPSNRNFYNTDSRVIEETSWNKFKWVKETDLGNRVFVRLTRNIPLLFIRAVNDQRHQLLIKPDPDRGRYASPGETITFSCISKGADPAPKLSFVIEGKNVSSDIDGAQVREVDVTEAINGGSYGSSGNSEQGGSAIDIDI